MEPWGTFCSFWDEGGQSVLVDEHLFSQQHVLSPQNHKPLLTRVPLTRTRCRLDWQTTAGLMWGQKAAVLVLVLRTGERLGCFGGFLQLCYSAPLGASQSLASWELAWKIKRPLLRSAFQTWDVLSGGADMVALERTGDICKHFPNQCSRRTSSDRSAERRRLRPNWSEGSSARNTKITSKQKQKNSSISWITAGKYPPGEVYY